MSSIDGKRTAGDRLGTAPLKGLIFSMALPTVAAQLVNLLYNLVDRVYVGHIPGEGAMALAGLGITFPVVIMVTAFSNLIGMGGASRASIVMGEGNRQQAEKILGNCMFLVLVLSIALSAFFMLFKEPVLRAFGASDVTLPYADDYLGVYLMGTFFVMAALSLNPFITNQGFAKTSMLTTCIGAVLNIALDPVFIYVLGMGVKGAAAATVISQAVSALWVLAFLRSRRSGLKLRLADMKPDRTIIWAVVSLGISPFVMSSTECLIQLTFNQGMVRYGNDMYVSLMSIMFSINQAVWMPMQGFAQGVQPIIGYNYGAGNVKRVWKSFYVMLAVCLSFSVLMVGTVVIWPEFYLSLFTSEQELVDLGAPADADFHVRHDVYGCAEQLPTDIPGTWAGEDFCIYRAATKSHSAVAAGDDPATDREYGSLGAVSGGAGQRYDQRDNMYNRIFCLCEKAAGKA